MFHCFICARVYGIGKMAAAQDHQKLVRAVILLIFALQIHLVLTASCSVHATFVVDSAATAAAGRRLLPVRAGQAAQSVEAKETVPVHPRSIETRASSSSSSAFMNAVSKHLVPSGANPDSN